MEYFTLRGTWVANGLNAVWVPTAEYCVSLILAMVKGLGVVDRNVRRGKWREGLGLQSNIRDMTLGIIGLGAIGKVLPPSHRIWSEGSGKKNEWLGSQSNLLEQETTPKKARKISLGMSNMCRSHNFCQSQILLSRYIVLWRWKLVIFSIETPYPNAKKEYSSSIQVEDQWLTNEL